MAKREFRKPRIEEKDEFDKKLLEVRRVTKVVKGGRTMRFSALVVVGDKKGRVGMGTAKASEVPMAVEKATKAAKKNLVTVPVVNGTVPYEAIGKFSFCVGLLLEVFNSTISSFVICIVFFAPFLTIGYK